MRIIGTYKTKNELNSNNVYYATINGINTAFKVVSFKVACRTTISNLRSIEMHVRIEILTAYDNAIHILEPKHTPLKMPWSFESFKYYRNREDMLRGEEANYLNFIEFYHDISNYIQSLGLSFCWNWDGLNPQKSNHDLKDLPSDLINNDLLVYDVLTSLCYTPYDRYPTFISQGKTTYLFKNDCEMDNVATIYEFK